MAHLIDKDAALAKIEKMLQEEYLCDNSEQTVGYHCALYELQDFLDTLEAKELENSNDAFIDKAKKWFEKQNEWHDINGVKHCDMESFEDFRNYMEGE